MIPSLLAAVVIGALGMTEDAYAIAIASVMAVSGGLALVASLAHLSRQ